MKTKSFTFLCLCFLLLSMEAEAQNTYSYHSWDGKDLVPTAKALNETASDMALRLDSNLTEMDSISLHPNPARNHVKVELKEWKDGEATPTL